MLEIVTTDKRKFQIKPLANGMFQFRYTYKDESDHFVTSELTHIEWFNSTICDLMSRGIKFSKNNLSKLRFFVTGN